MYIKIKKVVVILIISVLTTYSVIGAAEGGLFGAGRFSTKLQYTNFRFETSPVIDVDGFEDISWKYNSSGMFLKPEFRLNDRWTVNAMVGILDATRETSTGLSMEQSSPLSKGISFGTGFNYNMLSGIQAIPNMHFGAGYSRYNTGFTKATVDIGSGEKESSFKMSSAMNVINARAGVSRKLGPVSVYAGGRGEAGFEDSAKYIEGGGNIYAHTQTGETRLIRRIYSPEEMATTDKEFEEAISKYENDPEWEEEPAELFWGMLMSDFARYGLDLEIGYDLNKNSALALRTFIGTGGSISFAFGVNVGF